MPYEHYLQVFKYISILFLIYFRIRSQGVNAYESYTKQFRDTKRQNCLSCRVVGILPNAHRKQVARLDFANLLKRADFTRVM